jgi:hypothetical protein
VGHDLILCTCDEGPSVEGGLVTGLEALQGYKSDSDEEERVPAAPLRDSGPAAEEAPIVFCNCSENNCQGQGCECKEANVKCTWKCHRGFTAVRNMRCYDACKNRQGILEMPDIALNCLKCHMDVMPCVPLPAILRTCEAR